ncbi:hypothetical protein TEA_026695 [Camellia sinensis var. sinensis]|uniref:Uncharacterized protein n=1 Tax=Camellia sinensis var. sinensis TaxID=542762 RepID=A0A4S4ER13_CAMSN|nr:hypothetical protein TEA_026695 [Camellia sinensis var. sinensis]
MHPLRKIAGIWLRAGGILEGLPGTWVLIEEEVGVGSAGGRPNLCHSRSRSAWSLFERSSSSGSLRGEPRPGYGGVSAVDRYSDHHLPSFCSGCGQWCVPAIVFGQGRFLELSGKCCAAIYGVFPAIGYGVFRPENILGRSWRGSWRAAGVGLGRSRRGSWRVAGMQQAWVRRRSVAGGRWKLEQHSYVHWVFVFLLLQLDEKARVVLKNLLDGATERVFEAHSKFMEAQLGLYNLLPAIQLEKLKGMPMLRPPVSPDVSIISHGVGQSSAKAPNCNPITTREDKRTIITPTTQASVSEWSKFSSSAMEPQNRKRRCRACQQRSVKQVKAMSPSAALEASRRKQFTKLNPT